MIYFFLYKKQVMDIVAGNFYHNLIVKSIKDDTVELLLFNNITINLPKKYIGTGWSRSNKIDSRYQLNKLNDECDFNGNAFQISESLHNEYEFKEFKIFINKIDNSRIIECVDIKKIPQIDIIHAFSTIDIINKYYSNKKLRHPVIINKKSCNLCIDAYRELLLNEIEKIIKEPEDPKNPRIEKISRAEIALRKRFFPIKLIINYEDIASLRHYNTQLNTQLHDDMKKKGSIIVKEGDHVIVKVTDFIEFDTFFDFCEYSSIPMSLTVIFGKYKYETFEIWHEFAINMIKGDEIVAKIDNEYIRYSDKGYLYIKNECEIAVTKFGKNIDPKDLNRDLGEGIVIEHGNRGFFFKENIKIIKEPLVINNMKLEEDKIVRVPKENELSILDCDVFYDCNEKMRDRGFRKYNYDTNQEFIYKNYINGSHAFEKFNRLRRTYVFSSVINKNNRYIIENLFNECTLNKYRDAAIYIPNDLLNEQQKQPQSQQDEGTDILMERRRHQMGYKDNDNDNDSDSDSDSDSDDFTPPSTPPTTPPTKNVPIEAVNVFDRNDVINDMIDRGHKIHNNTKNSKNSKNSKNDVVKSSEWEENVKGKSGGNITLLEKIRLLKKKYIYPNVLYIIS